MIYSLETMSLNATDSVVLFSIDANQSFYIDLSL